MAAVPGFPDYLDCETIIRSFERYTGPSSPGHVIDFLGVRTRIDTVSVLGSLGGRVEDYPLPMNFHATALEWAGSLQAVRDAEAELTVFELGAGWGPWLAIAGAAARASGIHRCRLVGVEGCRAHCEYMRRHLDENGIAPEQVSILHGVVGVADGTMLFPRLANPAGDYGAEPDRPASWPTRVRRRVGTLARRLLRRPPSASSAPPMEKVRCWSLQTLTQPYPVVDLMHIDIQGSEATLVARGGDALRQKVRRLVIGTHGRAIEQELLQLLPAQGWVLEGEESCRYQQHGGGMHLWRDGCQVWRNAALLPRARPATEAAVATN